MLRKLSLLRAILPERRGRRMPLQGLCRRDSQEDFLLCLLVAGLLPAHLFDKIRDQFVDAQHLSPQAFRQLAQ